MAHMLKQHLEERLSTLEDLERRNAGLEQLVLICIVCYIEKTEKGCLCGRNSWVHLAPGLMALRDAVVRNSRTAQEAMLTFSAEKDSSEGAAAA